MSSLRAALADTTDFESRRRQLLVALVAILFGVVAAWYGSAAVEQAVGYSSLATLVIQLAATAAAYLVLSFLVTRLGR